jgi:DNA-directed RNA polymerase subunit A'
MADEYSSIHVYKKVDNIQFGVFSPKLIKKMAVAKVVTPELYDKEGYPVDGGLMDIRLGVIDPGLNCKTCGSRLKECIGHFGYIELARPVIHVKFVSHIMDILKGTCRECGKALLKGQKVQKALEEINKTEKENGLDAKRDKAKEITSILKNIKVCPHCGARQQGITLEKPTTYMENEKRINPIEIRSRLEKVSDDDCKLFGLEPSFVRPEWMVMTVMLIPPVTMRPSITLESGERSEDDLTHKLGDIVRINQRLFENINAGAPEIIVEDLWDLLQYHITTFFDNEVPQLPPARHRSGQPLKTISERLKSKEGRIRHNLAGKRTNFSARTVISPDPKLKLSEVGIPQEIARKLTIPETVTIWNIDYLKEFIKRGTDNYPGANYILRPDGKRKRVTDETKEQLLEEIQPGYVVERHIMDGDVAIFNRQPSLHRMSMMCHRVKVLPGRTFRMNPAVCHPYNADFDGDEMNLHIPQTEEARAEAEILMEIQTQLISPRYGLNIIGCIHDAVSGNYMLTKYMELTRNEAIEMLYSIGVEDFSKLGAKKTVDGKEIFSVLLPDDLNFTGQSKDGNPVIIKKGKIIDGTIDEKSLGSEKALLFRAIHKKYGPGYTLDFIEKAFQLGIKALLKIGFSTGTSDVDLPKEAIEQIETVLKKAREDTEALIQEYRNKTLEILPGRTIEETLERRILLVLNKARNETGQIADKYSKEDNQIIIMARSGARGGPLNMAQMSACVGQQSMRGKRIETGYKERTLSCYKKDDLSAEARGFIKNSFKKGLTPAEFFFGAITGRDSLMDTALRTPKSGYLYRRLANAMQDLKVEYDGTVRDSGGKIVQFAYGEDGIDVSKSENGKINVKQIIEEITGE